MEYPRYDDYPRLNDRAAQPVPSASAAIAEKPRPLGLRDRQGNPIRPDDPNFPHIYTFAGIVNQASKTYSWRSDEANKESVENSLAMRRDCYLQGLLREWQLKIERQPWHLEPEDVDDLEAEEAVTFLTACVKAIPHFRRYRRSLLEARWYGRSGARQGWGWTEVMGERAYTVLAHNHVNGDKLQFKWDGTPCLLIYSAAAAALEAQGAEVIRTDRNTALVLSGPWRTQYAIHKEDCIDADFFDPIMAGGIHGVGIRHWVYWGNWVKQEVLSWLLDFMERTGCGLTIYYYEEGNPQSMARAQDEAKQDGRNTVIVWPRSPQGEKVGPGIERIETSPAGAQVLMKVVDYFDEKIERFITGNTMRSTGKGQGGAGGGDLMDLYGDAAENLVQDGADSLAETITEELIEPLKRFNRPAIQGKIRFCIDMPDRKAAQKVAAMGVAQQAKLPIKTEEAYQALGFSKPTDGDEIIDWSAIADEEAARAAKNNPKGPLDASARGDWPERYGFDPFEPRDDIGRWTDGTGKQPKKKIAERGREISHNLHQAISAVLGRVQRGETHHETAKAQLWLHFDKAAQQTRKNFVNRYRAFGQRVAAQYGPEAMESPEWENVKKTFGDGMRRMIDLAENMKHDAHLSIEHHQKHGGFDVGTKNYLAQNKDALDEAHTGWSLEMADAFDAFAAKHKKPGGPQTLETTAELLAYAGLDAPEPSA